MCKDRRNKEVRTDEWEHERKIRRNTGKSRSGWNCFCISVSNSEETLDEVILLRPTTQKPIFLQEVIFIFPFRVYW